MLCVSNHFKASAFNYSDAFSADVGVEDDGTFTSMVGRVIVAGK